MRGGRLLVVLLIVGVVCASVWAGVLVLSGGGEDADGEAQAPDVAGIERGGEVLSDGPSDEHARDNERVVSPVRPPAAGEGPERERERVDPTRGWRTARAQLQDAAWWASASSADRREVAEVIEARATGFAFQAVRTYESGDQKHAVAVFKHARSRMEFVLLAGGTFQMGSPTDEPGHQSDETQHDVTLSPFLIARTEVPQRAWAREFKIVPSRWDGDNLPVEGVKWGQAQRYCERVGLSLPTEAQWEYACRGGEAGPWSFGGDVRKLGDHAWFNKNGGSRTHRVGKKRPNAYGLHDMHGNVWEWCLDRHAILPFEPQTDPIGPAEGSAWVIKGGSYWDGDTGTRSARRLGWNVSQQNVGFRPVLRLD